MTTPRLGHTATLLSNGQVLIVGGNKTGDFVILASAELYDATSGHFTATGSMTAARRSHIAVLPPTGKVLVAGGEDSQNALDTAELYNADTPPTCELATANPSSHWPPNLQFISVSIAGVTDPDNDPVILTVTGVTQDEPVNGLGGGDTSPDAVIQPQGTVLLRAERSGQGNGRVYEVHFMAVDGVGGHCDGKVKVCVPHEQQPATCVDDGQRFDSTKP
jgi:hypothetical protein